MNKTKKSTVITLKFIIVEHLFKNVFTTTYINVYFYT